MKYICGFQGVADINIQKFDKQNEKTSHRQDATPEGKQRSPEALKAFVQLYNTTVQYFSSEVASEGFGPFQNLNPSARKHEIETNK